MKTCVRCNIAKPREDFYAQKRNLDGLDSWCKKCKSAYYKNLRDTDADKVAQAKKRNAAWYIKNKQHAAKVQAAWKKNNPDKVRQLTRDWRSNNRDKYRESVKKWRLANMSDIRGVKATARQIALLTHGTARKRRCVRCGQRAVHWHHWSYEVEHWANVVPVCQKCHTAHHTGVLVPPLSAKEAVYVSQSA